MSWLWCYVKAFLIGATIQYHGDKTGTGTTLKTRHTQERQSTEESREFYLYVDTGFGNAPMNSRRRDTHLWGSFDTNLC